MKRIPHDVTNIAHCDDSYAEIVRLPEPAS